MYCPRCGAEIAKGAAFCPACGASLSTRAHNATAREGAGGNHGSKQHAMRVPPRIILMGLVIFAVVVIVAFGLSHISGANESESAASSASGEAVTTGDAENSDAEDAPISDMAEGVTMSGKASITTTTSDSLGAWPSSISNGEVTLSNISIEQWDADAFPSSLRDAMTDSSHKPRFIITADAENLTIDPREVELHLYANYYLTDEYGDWQKEERSSSLTSPEASTAYLAPREKREVVFTISVYQDKYAYMNTSSRFELGYYSDVALVGISTKLSGGIVAQSDLDDAIELTGDNGVSTTMNEFNDFFSRPSFIFTNTSDDGITSEQIYYTYRYDGNLLPVIYYDWVNEALKPGESSDFTSVINGGLGGVNNDDGLLELVPLYCLVFADTDL